jgi:hypothetical protein
MFEAEGPGNTVQGYPLLYVSVLDHIGWIVHVSEWEAKDLPIEGEYRTNQKKENKDLAMDKQKPC